MMADLSFEEYSEREGKLLNLSVALFSCIISIRNSLPLNEELEKSIGLVKERFEAIVGPLDEPQL